MISNLKTSNYSFFISIFRSRNISKDQIDTSKITLAMIFAMLSVFFERLHRFDDVLSSGNFLQFMGTIIVGLAIISVFSETLKRWAPWILLIGLIPAISDDWSVYANHGWLAVWLLAPAPFVRDWWHNEDYWSYIRITLGIVMLAACLQKLFAGTYLDGSYISYLSYQGGTTEQLFGFLCDAEEAYNAGCLWHKSIGTFLVIWQAIVGILLIVGLRAPLFLFIEIAFLIGAGVYADEFNFQVLNIAFLTIAFGVGMSRWLAVCCSAMLLVDFYSLTRILDDIILR